MRPSKYILILVASFASACSSPATSASTVTGQWQQTDLLGMGQSSKSCAWLSYLTRKLTIDTAPDGSLYGTYSNYEQAVWTLRADPDCKFSVPTMSQALFQRARLWPVQLKPLGDRRWKLSASTARCTGDSCNDPTLWKAGFETEISLDGTELVDRGDGVADTSKMLRYRPVAEAMKVSDNALTALANLMQSLDSGECNGFCAQSLHPQSPLQGHQSDFCNVRRQMWSLQPQRVVDSRIINSVALDRVVQPNGSAERTADVLLIGSAVFQDGGALPRIVTLRRQQESWKVFAMFAH